MGRIRNTLGDMLTRTRNLIVTDTRTGYTETVTPVDRAYNQLIPLDIPAVRRAVDAIGNAVAYADKTFTGESRFVKAIEEAPNPQLSPAEFWLRTVMHYLIDGNAYWQIRLTDGRAELYPIDPTCVEVLCKDGAIVGYKVKVKQGSPVDLDNNEVLHIRRPGSRWQCGDAMVDNPAMSALLDKMYWAIRLARAYYRRGGRNPIGVSSKLSNEAQADSLRKGFEATLGDIDSQQVFTVPNDATLTELGAMPNLADELKSDIQELGRYFSIPPTVMYENSRSTFSNTAEEAQAFVNQGVRPLARVIARQIQLQLRVEIEFGFDRILAGTRSEELDTDIALLGALDNAPQWFLDKWTPEA